MGAVAKKASTEVAYFEYGEDAGAGFENQTGADYSIPFIAVLQQMSPQCGDPRDGGIEGAKPGMLFNTVTGEVWDGKDGLEFVPATTEHVFVEWVPREKGGGIQGRHSLESDVVQKARARGEGFGKLKTATGNDLIETFYVYGVLCQNGQPSERAVIAFTSTKIKTYKNFNTKVRMYLVPTPDGRKVNPPLFSHRVRLTSVKEKNNKGEFYNFVLSPANGDVSKSLMPPNDDRYQAGKEMKSMVEDGRAKADFASQQAAGNSESGGGDRAPF